jgi:hypothetical protein
MQIMPTDKTTDTVPTKETAGTTSETITTGTALVADPLKDGIPLFLQTQNRDRGTGPLLIFEVAKHAIAAATTAAEVKDIRDKALGLAAYAREANDRQLEAEAVEIRARAARRLGEMIEAQKETFGLNTGTAGKGRPSLGGSNENPPKDDRPTLPSQGIKGARARGPHAREDAGEGIRGACRGQGRGHTNAAPQGAAGTEDDGRGRAEGARPQAHGAHATAAREGALGALSDCNRKSVRKRRIRILTHRR